MKYMRIVGYGLNVVHVQTSNHRNRNYEQTRMTPIEFMEFMKREFPHYWQEYLDKADTDTYPEKFFYHYGETPEMIRKGEAFVFEK